MTITLNGSTGIAGPNGTASAPAMTGTTAGTGIVYGTNTVSLATNGTAQLNIDSSGRVTMPSQPMFMAFRSGGTVTSPAQIIFDTAAVNVGSVYNTSTGRFTAPIAGTYFLTICLTINGNANCDANIKLNGSNYAYMAAPGTAGLYNGIFTQAFVITLAANDYVTVDVINGSISSNSQYAKATSFSGFLIG
jgi:hypothetical protein